MQQQIKRVLRAYDGLSVDPCCGITLDMLKAIATGKIRMQYGKGRVWTIGDATIVESKDEAMITGTLLSESINKGRNFTIRASAVTKVF